MDSAEFHRQRRRVWSSYETTERERAERWKAASPFLPDSARPDGTYGSRKTTYPFCLPRDQAPHNLLEPVRDEALRVFEKEHIAWHQGVGGGPTNHLVSSQVQCVNAMGHLMRDEERLRRAFAGVLDLGRVDAIEEDRLVTFEYVGPTRFQGLEDGRLRRGAHSTSVDAAFIHQHPDRGRELVLVEWKYTERYGLRSTSPRATAGDPVRLRRYMHLVSAPEGPIRDNVLPPSDLLQEPFYQLMRQQLLASALEGRFSRHGIAAPQPAFDRVVVVHVSPPANTAYPLSLSTDTQLAVGSTVAEVWQSLLKDADRFLWMSSEVFLDPDVTSPHYVERYAG